MPLVRYRIGDLVECTQTPYGKRYVLHGRLADAFQISDGRRVTTRQVDQCFVGMERIAHYQLIQQKHGAWVLRFVADSAGASAEDLAALAKKLTQLLQADDLVKLQQTDILVPERSGKFRLGYPTKKL
jgi:phenylacetate-coenzyme A ligase PaaK-like adenylate-forming protein